MKATTILAVVLIVAGVLALAYEGITYTRTRTVLDIGPIEARVEEKRTIPLPPILGALAIVGGVALLVARRMTSASKA
jgi:uncharacterized membrane protein HdeD (DUF308 family)